MSVPGETPSAVVVIPARGGSQGVPLKNLARVDGITLVGRAVQASLAASSVAEVIVSTDHDEIAAEARLHGARVVARPAEIAGGTASSESALQHVLDRIEAGDGGLPPQDVPPVTVLVQCTSPFIDPEDLDTAIRRVANGEKDVVVAVSETHDFQWRIDDGVASPVGHTTDYRPRRQDRAPHFRETGAFYVMEDRRVPCRQHRFFGASASSRSLRSRPSRSTSPATSGSPASSSTRTSTPRLVRSTSTPSSRTSTACTPTTTRSWTRTATEQVRVQPRRRHGRRAPASRRHADADPLDRDQPGGRARAPTSCRSRSCRVSTTRRPPCATGSPSRTSTRHASRTSATTSTTCPPWRSSAGPWLSPTHARKCSRRPGWSWPARAGTVRSARSATVSLRAGYSRPQYGVCPDRRHRLADDT